MKLDRLRNEDFRESPGKVAVVDMMKERQKVEGEAI